MTYRGRVRNGSLVLDAPVELPDGAEVEVDLRAVQAQPAAESTSIWTKLLGLAGTAKGLPEDAARNHDHYLYGTPKR